MLAVHVPQFMRSAVFAILANGRHQAPQSSFALACTARLVLSAVPARGRWEGGGES